MSLHLNPDEELRRDCLKLAIDTPHCPDQVELARRFYAFVRGEDGATELALAKAKLRNLQHQLSLLQERMER